MKKFSLITGSASGLGKEISKLLAKENHNLILVDINENSLKETEKEITEINKDSEIITLAYDLSNKDSLKKIYEYTKSNGYFINYVINAAGFGDREDFIKMNIDRQMKMTDVCCNALLYFSQVYLEDMLKNNEGHILNISSIAGFMPGPFMSTYHAVKSYVLFLGEAISYELRNTNIKVTTLCPGPFLSNFVKVAGNEYTFKKIKPLTSEKVALIGLKALKKGKTLKIIGFKNKLMIFAIRLAPRSLVRSISAHSLKKF